MSGIAFQGRRWSAAALAFATASAAAQDKSLTAEELYERVAPSVWMVQVRHADGNGIGSAVVIGAGTLVTNCHVVEKAQTIAVRHGSRRFAAQLQYRDPTRDLCQLIAPGIDAPPVTVADWSTLRIGAKLYALGNPRGLELTLSDGLLSGIRCDAADNIDAIQISVPISPGSSGGGLFDTYGRLVGITTSGLRESQNLNFALPATWIAQLPARAGPGGIQSAPQAKVQEPPPPEGGRPVATAGGPNVFEYQLRDRLTGLTRAVVYRVDRRDGGVVVINGGTRVEEPGGRVLTMSAPIAGEFEQAMPPGGWVTGQNARLPGWESNYVSAGDGRPFKMELRAQAEGEDMLQVNGRAMRTVRVQFSGYTTRGGGVGNNPPGRYAATAWYAPDLGRVVRFHARSRGGLGHTAFVVDEVLELVDVRSN